MTEEEYKLLTKLTKIRDQDFRKAPVDKSFIRSIEILNSKSDIVDELFPFFTFK